MVLSTSHRRAGTARGIRLSHRGESAPKRATPEGTLDDGGRLGQITFLHEAHRLRHAALHLVTMVMFSLLSSVEHLYTIHSDGRLHHEEFLSRKRGWLLRTARGLLSRQNENECHQELPGGDLRGIYLR